MASPSPIQKPQNRTKNLSSILKDLHRGKELSNRLSFFINGSTEGKDLMDEISNIFSRVISDSSEPNESSSVVLSEASNGKRKLNDESTQKTGCRKRPRPGCTRTVKSKILEDGQAWRKYGQKQILNSNNPRSYFRCTHKADQGCKAQRQVQKSEEDPNTYIITYMFNHTCKNPFSFIQTSSPHDSCIISFESSKTNYPNDNKINQQAIMSPSSQSFGGEEEVLSNCTAATDQAVARISEQEQRPDQMDVASGSDYWTDDFFDELLDRPLDFDVPYWDLFQSGHQ